MASKEILGIDPSFTATAVVSSSGEKYLFKSNPKHTIPERIIYLWDSIEQIITELDDVIVGIEGFSFMSKGRAIGNMFGLGWFLRCMLYENGIEYYEIPPNSWKKFLFKSNFRKGVGKDHILLETYKRYGMDYFDNNLCDAFNIMKTTDMLYRLRTGSLSMESLNKSDQDLFKKLL